MADDDGIDLTSVDEAELDDEQRDELWKQRGGHATPVDADVDYDLSSNVAYDLVQYVRSNTVRNEQQFMLATLGYLTGYFTNIEHYVSGVLIGTSSSGKTHVQKQLENLFRDEHMYQATTGSDKSLIYDGEWDDAHIASLDELQKPSDTIIEFLKSCFTPDTDVMTPNGVVNIQDLDVGDDVYSIDPETEELHVKEVTDTVEKPNYDGRLIDMETDNTSFRMTPDHELLRYRGDDLVTETADELSEMSSFQLPVHEPRDGSGVSDLVDLLDELDGDYPCVIDTDGTEYITANEGSGWIPRYVDRDDWVEFIGWYVTEGSCRKNTPPYQINISQDRIDEIAACVDRMGVSYSRHEKSGDSGGDMIVITNELLHNILSEQCGRKSGEKQLPGWVFDMSVERKQALFETLMAGDGNDAGYTYYTVSTQLRDDVLRLVTELGRIPSYRNDNASVNYDEYWAINVTDNQQWVTSEHGISETHTDDIETDGVYCVTVEDNHTLLAGRNGKFSHARNCHSDDEQFEYKLTPDSAEKREAEEVQTITRTAKPYWFLFAQFDTDFEMWNRLMKVPVHESESKNKAVGALSHDHYYIQIGDEDTEYGFDFDDGTTALQSHIASIPEHIDAGEIPGRVFIPNGDPEAFDRSGPQCDRTGGFEWDSYEVLKPIYNHGRSESNRVYDMVTNLVRASAMLNYHNRDVEYIDVPNHAPGEYIIAEPQDVANVLACREALLATTHELDDKKRKICSAIEHNTGANNEADMSTLVDGLDQTDMSMLSRTELRNHLEKLHENYLIEINRDGAENGSGDTYIFHGWGELGFANVPEHDELFETTFDPVSGDNFIDAHERLRGELEDTGQDLTQGADTDISSNAGGQRTLGGGSTRSIDLDPHEESVREHAFEALDGTRVSNLDDVPVEGLLGLTDPNDPDRPVETEGTPLDPTNGCWYQPNRSEDWIDNEQAARREVKNAIRNLIDQRVIIFDEVHEVNKKGEPEDVTFQVLGEADI